MNGGPSDQPAARGAWRWWLMAFAVAAVLYTATSNRGVQWQDSGWQQYRILTGSIEHPLGLALTHPVQFYLGRVFINLLPIEPAWATTLLSALAGAVGVANIVLLVWLTTGVRVAAVLSGLSLLLAHTYWQYATLTESYTLVAALLSTEWLCLALFLRTRRSGWLVLLAVASGLGVANHLLAALAIPVSALAVVGIVWHERRRAWLLLVTPIVGVLAMTPYLWLVLQAGLESGDWVATVQSALFGRFQDQVLNTSLSPRQLALAVGYVIYNYADLSLIAAWLGWCWSAGRFTLLKRVVIVQAAIYFTFALRYDIVDQYTFFIPAYATLAVVSGWGWAWCAAAESRRRWASWLLVVGFVLTLNKPLTYFTAAEIARSQGWFARLVRNTPYRDGYASFFLPWSVTDDSTQQIVAQASELAGPKTVILTETSMVRHALQYAQALGQFPEGVSIGVIMMDGHELQSEVAAAIQAGDAVILIPRDRDAPRYNSREGIWMREGDLYVLDATLAAR